MSVSNNDILHVVIEGVLEDGSIVQNRKRFKVEAAAPLSDAVVLTSIKAWVEILYGFVASQVPQTAVLADGTVDVIAWNPVSSLWEVTQNLGIYSPLDTFAGTAQELPNQCAAFLIGNTARPKSKGRLFVFPFDEASQDHGRLEAAALTALGNMAVQYILDQGVSGDALLSGIVRETANEWLDFETVSFSDSIGTQRRRRRGIGI